MYVCLCKNIKCSDIRDAAATGAASVRDLNRQFGLGAQCGKCVACARELLRDCSESKHARGDARLAC